MNPQFGPAAGVLPPTAVHYAMASKAAPSTFRIRLSACGFALDFFKSRPFSTDVHTVSV